MALYRVVEGYHHGRAIGCLNLRALHGKNFYSCDEGSTFLQNSDPYLPEYIALYSKNCTPNIHCHINPDRKFFLCELTKILFMFHSTIQLTVNFKIFIELL